MLSVLGSHLHAARALVAVRVAAFFLAVIVAGSAWIPQLARLALGGPDHVCHCSTRGGHGHCACPICVPELREDAAQGHDTGPSVRGTCGDPDEATGPLALRAVAPPAVLAVLAAPRVRLAAPCPPNEPSLAPRAPPPTPPPERAAQARARARAWAASERPRTLGFFERARARVRPPRGDSS